MKYLCILIFSSMLCFAAGQSTDRSAISTGGAYLSSSSNINLHCTIGQLAISDLDNGNTRLTEGFQQYYILTVSSSEENVVQKVLIYPNPTTDQLLIEYDQAKTYKLSLYDNLGRKVLSQSSNQQQSTVDIRMLTTGMYILHIHNEEDQLVYQGKVQKINF